MQFEGRKKGRQEKGERRSLRGPDNVGHKHTLQPENEFQSSIN